MSKVIAVYLAEFDVRSGYKLLWSYSTIDNFVFDAIEYKSLPSGIHDFKNATTYISHKSNNKIYYGLSCFRQFNIDDLGDNNDRNNLKMFTIGILCEPIKSEWKPNEFVNNGWEYIDEINEVLDLLEEDVKKNHKLDIEKFSKKFKSIGSNSNLSLPKEPIVKNHLLLNLPKLFELTGPLVFTIYKQSLLRKNILFFNETHVTEEQEDTYRILTSFSYLIAILSVIPKDIKITSKLSSQQPLYNIGLNELSTDLLEDFKQNGYIGVTSDEILKSHKIYDIGVEVQNNNAIAFQQSDKEKLLKSTIRDYHKFQSLYTKLTSKEFKFTNNSNISTDDLNSINSTDPKQFKLYTDISPQQVLNEPSWWKSNATEPVSWSESFWSAFSWFASAGQQMNGEEEEEEEEENITVSTSPSPTTKLDLTELLSVIGYFHRLTTKWFKYIDDLINETKEELQILESDQQELIDKVDLNISYQDILDMDLDPYSSQDIEFLKEFISLYFDDKVDNVNIGYNLTKICC
ncbi:uncharacterized protein KGF55_005536 [Candida pseudojiufengensis]|uniref:uncharacterized protein n=1 Tax=Candida pseudojiufengensis TaxID=497109 RepID=UPI002224D58E|nr:uncharacterized protein KGF55_005536 [Candida pseudojiufengensis]KAI5959046.1 hypothetical protein KGF55_005536 [Candida pseudojiufengensis]